MIQIHISEGHISGAHISEAHIREGWSTSTVSMCHDWVMNDCVCMQAIAEKKDSSSQTEWLKPCNKITQYVPRELSDSECQDLLDDPGMNDFLNKAIPRFVYTYV